MRCERRLEAVKLLAAAGRRERRCGWDEGCLVKSKKYFRMRENRALRVGIFGGPQRLSSLSARRSVLVTKDS